MSHGPRRIRIDLAYDGTDFSGWQVQPGLRTVQGTLEAALARIHGDRAVRVRGAGRTDAGVHARAQVADGELAVDADDASIAHTLHRLLPSDLRPLGVCTVPGGFHSRRDATAKTYRYFLDRTRYGDPLRSRYSLHVAGSFADPDALDRVLGMLPGRRDWAGFAGAGGQVVGTVRHLTEARYVEDEQGRGWFSFRADGFLNHMVRNLVGTLLEVARGRFRPERVAKVLDSRDRRLAGPTAPARGLVLWEVGYGRAKT